MGDHIFISYSRADRAYVDRLAAYLAEFGFSVWYDLQLNPGDRFETLIEQRIDECALLLVVLTPASVASNWVRDETSYALNRGRAVIPLLLASTPIPIRLNAISYEDVTNGRLPPRDFLERLRNVVAGHPQQEIPRARTAPTPSPWLVDALTGHTGNIWTVAWSPDGRRIASAGDDAKPRIWDTATGETLLVLTGHSQAIEGRRGIAWSPDGRLLATASADSTAKIWDTATGDLLTTLPGSHRRNALNVAWSPDGQYLAVSTDKPPVAIWNVSAGVALRTLDGDHVIAWSPDGQHLATSGESSARVWDPTTGALQRNLTVPKTSITDAAWSPDGRRLAVVSYDGIARIWDPATGKLVQSMSPKLASLVSIDWSPDGSQLLITGLSPVMVIVNSRTGTVVRSIASTSVRDSLQSGSFSPDGRHFAAASVSGGLVRIWPT